MTQLCAWEYEYYIEWIDEMLKELRKEPWVWAEQFCASLLANKATLERHKLIQILGGSKHDGGITRHCCECKGIFGATKVAPCPSLLDVTNQLDEVMR
jgi:hypothetical protein